MQKYILIVLGLCALAAARSMTAEKLLQEIRELDNSVTRNSGGGKSEGGKTGDGKSDGENPDNGEKDERVGLELLAALSNYIQHEISDYNLNQESSKGEGQDQKGASGEGSGGGQAGKETDGGSKRKRVW